MDKRHEKTRNPGHARRCNHLSANIGSITAIGGPIEARNSVRQVTERVSDSVRYAINTSRAVDDRAFIPRIVQDLIREKNRLHIHRVLDRGRQILGTVYPMMAGRERLDPSLKVRPHTSGNVPEPDTV
ncbi:hypothetical protein Trydic_g16184 [Trypoxylus dichotomus]